MLNKFCTRSHRCVKNYRVVVHSLQRTRCLPEALKGHTDIRFECPPRVSVENSSELLGRETIHIQNLSYEYRQR
jgi:hypothetical protein